MVKLTITFNVEELAKLQSDLAKTGAKGFSDWLPWNWFKTDPVKFNVGSNNVKSLHIGLNSVDLNAYGWAGHLPDCEDDAVTMKHIMQAYGFATTLYKTQRATKHAVLNWIIQAGEESEPGEVYVITYSGHGSYAMDYSGEEEDDRDETWCLYDGQLLDDDLGEALQAFCEGSLVIFFIDCCHSGTSVRNVLPSLIPRFLPESVRENYNLVTKKAKMKSRTSCDVISYSACADNQVSWSSGSGGYFTLAVEQCLGNDAPSFVGSWRDLHKCLIRNVEKLDPPAPQSTQFNLYGPMASRIADWRVFGDYSED